MIVQLAEAACKEEGVALETLLYVGRGRWGAWPAIKQRVVYAMRQANPTPSYQAIARTIGMRSHSGVIKAYRREKILRGNLSLTARRRDTGGTLTT